MNRQDLHPTVVTTPAVDPPNPFRLYPGQLDYLSLVATKDYALVAADTGCGKTLFLVMLARLKCENAAGEFTGRVLIVAPGGTLRPPPAAEDDEDEELHLSMSQWRVEIARFAPKAPVFELFHWEDYLRSLLPDGSLPPGIFVTYYEALFRNDAHETIPDSWLERGARGRRVPGNLAHERLCATFDLDCGPSTRTYRWSEAATDDHPGRSVWVTEAVLQCALSCHRPGPARNLNELKVGIVQSFPPDLSLDDQGGFWTLEEIHSKYVLNYAEGVGETKRGIQCVAAACLAERIEADQQQRRFPCGQPVAADGATEALVQHTSCFDFIGLDESHYCSNLGAHLTRALLRLQPRFRFAFSATPIPNIATNLFSIMGWLCVPDWFRGGESRLNVAWPYHIADKGRFEQQFLTTERDLTQEDLNRDAGRKSVSCTRYSPVIASPARLLKIIRPTIAYISKPECNPRYQPPTLVDVRVPLGARQARVYAYFLQRDNVPGRTPLVRAAKQSTWLRAVAADPVTFSRKHLAAGQGVRSEFSPKLIATLELVREILAQGEQLVIVSARVGLSDIIQRRLGECGIGCARIDSTAAPETHSGEANRFKSSQVPVMLMGQKCATSHSFPQARFMIVVSIEWSWGPLHQARGRVDRVNSRPGVKIYCVLCRDSIEEAQFDRCATKGDAATICLEGRRVPRDFQPVDAGAILAANFLRWQLAGAHITEAEGTSDGAIHVRSEEDCEAHWPRLQEELKAAVREWKRASTPPVKLPEPLAPPRRTVVPSWAQILRQCRPVAPRPVQS